MRCQPCNLVFEQFCRGSCVGVCGGVAGPHLWLAGLEDGISQHKPSQVSRACSYSPYEHCDVQPSAPIVK